MDYLSRMAIVGAAALVLSGCGTVSGFRKAATTNVCQDVTVSIYFKRDSAAIGREGRAVLKSVGDLAKGCAPGGVDVVGLADAVGDPEANLALSRQRAEAVRAAAARLGFDPANFRIAALGEAGAVASGGLDKPLRRRAEVTFHLKPR